MSATDTVRALARVLICILTIGSALAISAPSVSASDHLDTRTVVEDPTADIADLYAWMSTDGDRLNLVMTLIAHEFASDHDYVFHIDSGSRFDETTASTTISCRFPAPRLAECALDVDADSLRGDASSARGLVSQRRRFRVFAGLRDDPFFNNVRGTRDAWGVVARALEHTRVDAAGCPAFGATTSAQILDAWRHTEGGPPRNFLDGWQSATLVVSVDVAAVNAGGPLLAVWGGVYAPNGDQLDRMGRPLTANALLAPLAHDEVSDYLKEEYNRAAQPEWPGFAHELRRTLGLYDSFDGACGDQWLSDASAPPAMRYHSLADLLADDRLWVDSRASACAHFFAVERATLSGQTPAVDCGGRTPLHDAVDIYRSLLVFGAETGVDDGVAHDDHMHSVSAFPFLAAP